MKDLDYTVLFLQYDHAIDKCFTDLDICRLKKIGEGPCWSVHERCVIENTKKFKGLLKARGHE